MSSSGSIDLVEEIVFHTPRKEMIDSGKEAVFGADGSRVRHVLLQGDAEGFLCDSDGFDSALLVFAHTFKAMIEGITIWAFLIESVLLSVLREIGLRITGFDGTDLDMIWIDFRSQGIKQHIHRGFACTVESLERKWDDSSDGGGVDDFPFLLFPHMGKDSLGHEEGSEEADIDLLFRFLDWGLLKRPEDSKAGIVHQHIDSSVFSDDVGYCFLAIFRI